MNKFIKFIIFVLIIVVIYSIIPYIVFLFSSPVGKDINNDFTVKKLQEMNFFISGKVVLASAILLKIKSNRLVNEDIARLDNLLYPSEDDEELNYSSYKARQDIDIPPLATPPTISTAFSIELFPNQLIICTPLYRIYDPF